MEDTSAAAVQPQWEKDLEVGVSTPAGKIKVQRHALIGDCTANIYRYALEIPLSQSYANVGLAIQLDQTVKRFKPLTDEKNTIRELVRDASGAAVAVRLGVCPSAVLSNDVQLTPENQAKIDRFAHDHRDEVDETFILLLKEVMHLGHQTEVKPATPVLA
jgi:hypothetical protein